MEEKSYTESHVSNDGREQKSVTYYKVISVSFQDLNGNTVTAKESDGEKTLFSVGEQVEIFYDPESPTQIKFSKDQENSNILFLISGVSGTIFLILVFGFIMMEQLKKTKNSMRKDEF